MDRFRQKIADLRRTKCVSFQRVSTVALYNEHRKVRIAAIHKKLRHAPDKMPLLEPILSADESFAASFSALSLASSSASPMPEAEVFVTAHAEAAAASTTVAVPVAPSMFSGLEDYAKLLLPCAGKATFSSGASSSSSADAAASTSSRADLAALVPAAAHGSSFYSEEELRRVRMERLALLDGIAKPKCTIIYDGGHLRHSVQERYSDPRDPRKVSYRRVTNHILDLLEMVCAKEVELVAIEIHDCYEKYKGQNLCEEETNHLVTKREVLIRNGYVVPEYHMKYNGGATMTQSGVDSGISSHVMFHAYNVDLVIVVAGDQDYISTIRTLIKPPPINIPSPIKPKACFMGIGFGRKSDKLFSICDLNHYIADIDPYTM